MLIRSAVMGDIDQLVAVGDRFIEYSAYGALIRPEPDRLRDALRNLIQNEAIFVAEIEGRVIGVVAGLLSHVWFSPSTSVATELAWWVEAEHRGGSAGVKLLRRFEGWAKECGAHFIAMSDLGESPTSVTGLLKRLGYRVVERASMKELV